MPQEAINAIVRFSFIILVPCLFIFAVVLLIRVFRNASSSNSGRQKPECNTQLTTRIVSKRENVVLNPNSTMTFYYIEVEDSLEFRVEKHIYDSVDANDLVKILYSAGNLVELYIIEKSNESAIPNTTYSGHFTDNKK